MHFTKPNMNKKRIQQLQLLADIHDETNVMYVANKTGCSENQVRLGIQRFSEYGFIIHTGGDFFTISDRGRDYLASLK